MPYDIKDRFDILVWEDLQERDERRAKEKKERERKLKEIEDSGRCEGMGFNCSNTEGIEWVPAMTRYHWDIDEEPLADPNRSHFLCPVCAEEYVSYWEDRWADYYGGCM